jgi:hypothetical protein
MVHITNSRIAHQRRRLIMHHNKNQPLPNIQRRLLQHLFTMAPNLKLNLLAALNDGDLVDASLLDTQAPKEEPAPLPAG